MERTSALWAAYGPFFGSNLLLVFSKVYVSYVRNIKCILTKRCIISRELNFNLYYLSCWIESIPSLSARRNGMKEWASIEVKSSTADQQVKGEPVDVIDRKQLKAAGGLHKLAPQPPHYTIHYSIFSESHKLAPRPTHNTVQGVLYTIPVSYTHLTLPTIYSV